ncbi:MAG: Hpt domain-containing protein [Planctomycetes bacterium]|nr:Hpt domain-containing protein [Planctomycetota bacterium]
MSQQEQPGDTSDPIFSNILAECPELWDIIEQFARGLPNQLDEMQQAFEHDSYDQLIEWARTLAKAGRGHGYPELVAYAAAVERSARDHLVDALEAQLTDLRDISRQIQAGIDMKDPVDDQSGKE